MRGAWPALLTQPSSPASPQALASFTAGTHPDAFSAIANRNAPRPLLAGDGAAGSIRAAGACLDSAVAVAVALAPQKSERGKPRHTHSDRMMRKLHALVPIE